MTERTKEYITFGAGWITIAVLVVGFLYSIAHAAESSFSLAMTFALGALIAYAIIQFVLPFFSFMKDQREKQKEERQ